MRPELTLGESARLTFPFAPRCGFWPHTGSRCTAPAAVWLRAPDGKLVPGCYYCRRHANATVSEYQAKLGERWSTVPLNVLAKGG